MKKIILMAVFVVTSLGIGQVESAQTPNLPMLPSEREGMFTSISQMTDQWLELDGFAGKKVFALSDGKQMDNIVLPAPLNSYIENSISTETKGPSGNFPYVQADNGKRYMPNSKLECNNTDKKRFYGSGCGVYEIYPDGYYLVIETPTYSDYHIYRFYKVGTKDELWHLSCYGDASIYRIGRWYYIYSNVYDYDAYSFYEVETGKNVLNTHFKFNNNKSRISLFGDYLFIYGRVFDTKTWGLLFASGVYYYAAKIWKDKIIFIVDIKIKDNNEYLYMERSLVDPRYHKDVKTGLPLRYNKNNTIVYGCLNNFVYYFNPVNTSFEILNVETKQVVFSHPFMGFDFLNAGSQPDNGRYIVFMDKSDIFCYDTQTGKLWKLPNTELLTSGSCDGQWFISNSSYTDGRNWIDLTRTSPDGKVTITDVKGRIYTELDCVLEVVQNDYEHIFKVIRHELDGTVKTLEPPIKYDRFLYPFLYNGHWHFATIVDDRLIIMTTDKKSIRIVFEQEVDKDVMFIRHENDELLFTQSKTKLVIIKNLATGNKETFDIDEGVTWPEFTGRRYILFKSGFPFSPRILDRKTGNVVPYEKMALIDVDGETMYFSGENSLSIFKDGKFETYPTKSSIRAGKVKDGLIFDSWSLHDTSGQFIQKLNLPRIGSASDTIKDVNSFSNNMSLYLGQDETLYPNSIVFETCPTFSLNRGDNGLVLENISKDKISGKIWIADLESKENVVEFDSIDFVCKGGEKLEFGKSVASGHFVVYVESNAMMDTSRSALENVKQDYEMPLYEGNPLYSEKQKSVVVTEWRK